jgi:hypothetical protein
VKNFRVVNPNDMIGLSSQMEEEEVERLVGSSPIHLSGEGYAALAEAVISMVESKRAVFEGGKREREEEEGAGTWSGCTTLWQGLASEGSPCRNFTTTTSNRSGRKQDGYKSRNQYGGYYQVAGSVTFSCLFSRCS